MTLYSVLGMLAVQTVLNVPAYSPPGALPPIDRPDRLSLVIATTVSETDPRPLCERPNCTSLYLGRYTEARTLAGPAVGPDFSARVEMGSPWNRPYRLAMVVEHREGEEPLVRALAGFSQSTGLACMDAKPFATTGWIAQGEGVIHENDRICVAD